MGSLFWTRKAPQNTMKPLDPSRWSALGARFVWRQWRLRHGSLGPK
ncbi:hypothetical protein DUNSADRAFT_6354 [Dunaliella salina]|uniref:Uncharacterized protein n=1 Tax=Dunaliella salina TaxID=3046 RepID=A0ABQ7GNF6_DUNSA|nr:hypothetical protein DUNSADRAFT_6354 [Dunaliella salina]|eukprot:KAF5836151.1 hypothetical protein DUNSADRAFT_6354 [Dunaliella salina]